MDFDYDLDMIDYGGGMFPDVEDDDVFSPRPWEGSSDGDDDFFDPHGPFDDVVTGGVGRPPHDTSHLSDHQIEALKTIADWFNSGKGQVFRLFGCAGVGKTTLAKSVAPELRLTDDRYMFAAYTGKAVHVLRGKGCLPASTLHSLLYLPAGNQAEKDLERAKARLEKLQPGTPEHKECRSTIKELEIAAKQLGWKLNPESPLAELDLLICDEVSMVDAEMATDILSFGVRVLVLGDTEQLPPVGGTAGYFTAVKPDFELTEVHRQAAESPVLRLATRIRTSTDRSFGLTAADYVAPPRMADALGYDQVLCGTNRSRWTFIEGARRALGYPVGMPVAGDKVICLKNNRDLGIFNGQQFVVLTCTEEADGVLALSLRGDDDREYAVLSFHGGFLGLAGEKALGFKGFSGRIGAFTFAWAITCHKCVHPDTLVETPEGLIPIREIPDSGVIGTPGSAAYYEGKFTKAIGPVLTFATKRGYELTVTPEHGLTVWRDGHVRVEAGETREGDWLRMRLESSLHPVEPPVLPRAGDIDVRAVHHRIPQVMTLELAEFMGLMVADGTIFKNGRGVRLAKRHRDVVERFVLLADMIFGYEATIGTIMNGTPSAVINSTHIAGWLSLVGGMAPHAKYVPDAILRSPLPMQAAFLRGLFEDGGVNVKNGMIDHVEWNNESYAVVGVVQTMLLRFGIISTRKKYRNNVRLSIYSKSAQRFARSIGFVASEKNDRLHAGARYSKNVNFSIPVTRAELSSIESKMTESDIRNARRRGHLSRHVAFMINVATEGSTFLAERLTWHYEPVASIVAGESETMCVTVPDGGRFLQNGFDGWNSQGSEWDRVLIWDEARSFARDGLEGGRRWLYTGVTRASTEVALFRR